MRARRALESLRNIPGVYGSFLVGPSGSVVARDISSIIGDADILRAALSAARMWRQLAPLESADIGLEFSAHQLFLLRQEGHTLCVFASPRVDASVLRDTCRLLPPWLDAPVSP